MRSAGVGLVRVVGEPGRDVGEPLERRRDLIRGDPPLGDLERDPEEGLDHSGALLPGQHVEDAREQVLGGELPVEQHLEPGHHGLGAVDRLGEVGRTLQEHPDRRRGPAARPRRCGRTALSRCRSASGRSTAVEVPEVSTFVVPTRPRPSRGGGVRADVDAVGSWVLVVGGRRGDRAPLQAQYVGPGPVEPGHGPARPGPDHPRPRWPTSGRRAPCCPTRGRGSRRGAPSTNASSPTYAISCLSTLAPLV